MTPRTPAIGPVEHDEDEDESVTGAVTISQRITETDNVPLKDPVLALRVSRTGHLFAVITATSITVWQTKVRRVPLPASQYSMLTHPSRP
jgi:hypothetical protein